MRKTTFAEELGKVEKKYAFSRKLQFSIYMAKALINITTVKKLLWRHIKAIYIFIPNIIPIFGIWRYDFFTR
jgi:hypothetical protein